MGRSKFTKEFKSEAIRLARASDKPMSKIATTVGVSAKSLRDWIRQAEVDSAQDPGSALTTAEKGRLSKLERENRELRRERDFLQQAAAYFAKVSK